MLHSELLNSNPRWDRMMENASRWRRIGLAGVASMGISAVASAQVCFETASPVPPSNAQGRTIRHADMDGDGDQDLIVANQTAGSIAIYWNQGDGSFAAPSVLPTGLLPISVTAADFDGDGLVDLAFVDAQAGLMGVMLNQGGGTFLPPQTYYAPIEPLCIISADLDGDGDADLVASGESPDWIIVFKNQGDGTFVVGTVLVGGYQPIAIAVGDIDGDGDVDLAIANFEGSSPGCGCSAGNSVSIFKNNGDGTFATDVRYPVGALPYDVALADLDHDGDLDVVAAGWLNGGVTVWKNNGDGTFAQRADYGTGIHPQSLAIADVDDDGDLDVISADAYITHGKMTILLNQGNATFPNRVQYDIGTDLPYSVTAVDLDADGDADLALLTEYPGTGNVLVYRNCMRSGIPFCAGDGSGTACPCGNASGSGSVSGCVNSLGHGGSLRATGSASLVDDELVLNGSGMPDSSALYFQGTSATNGGMGATFGDGLRCVGGTVFRLGVVGNTAGASHYPGSGGSAVSVKGQVGSPGTRYYQVRYRNTAAFCTSDTFNMTNALSVIWFP